MPQIISDEAIVLKTYNVGEADRFCLLLTRSLGRVAARAHSVRRIGSRRGPLLLPMQLLDIELRKHSDGILSISTAAALQSPQWTEPDLRSFACIQQGIELLLTFVEEGHPVEDIFLLTRDFLGCSIGGQTAALPLFTLVLFSMLGLLPSPLVCAVSHRPLALTDQVVFHRQSGALCLASEHPTGQPISPDCHRILTMLRSIPFDRLAAAASPMESELAGFARLLVVSQLSGALKAPPVAARISPGATPIW